jgi:protein SCO1
MSRLITFASFIIILIVAVFVAYNIILPKEKLKIYNPSDVNPKLLDPEMQGKHLPHRIADFNLINQVNKRITKEDLKGNIYVADFFFTTCPSICPAMSANMKRVYDTFVSEPDIKLVSHTVMPEVDTPEVLKEYSERYGASANKWLFLTGSKEDIYTLARKSYFAVFTEGSGDEHDFIHTENLILVDKDYRIRGFYDGTSKTDLDRLIKEIKILKKEYK